ncbi:codanin-1-like [Corticium candelabrum]|uniref:codanin-1-like n=1 Tax=Corticium candelabrum TaxID=121492 RepID=UPI002E26C8B4|nr:codanin-1-like [Corticium candelabrum]
MYYGQSLSGSQQSKQRGARQRHRLTSGNGSKPVAAKKHLDLNDPDLFPRLGSQADLQARSRGSAQSRRRINPTPVSSLSSSHPAISTPSPSSLAFAISEEVAPKRQSFASIAANKVNKCVSDKPLASTTSEITDHVDCLDRLSTTAVQSAAVLVHPSRVCCMSQLERVSGLYVALIKEHWIANVFGEMYFIVQLLTAASVESINSSSSTSEIGITLFHNVSDSVHFAVSVLEQLSIAYCMLGEKTIGLLAENNCVKLFKPSLSDYFATMRDRKEAKIEANCTSSLSFPVPFSSVGHVDQFHRQLFASDRSFHNFKKQRDVLHAVIREWESHWLDPDWTIGDCFGATLRLMADQLFHHGILYQFTQLFLQLLLQLARADGPMVANDAASLPAEYGRMDSSKLKCLEERLVKPIVQQGPCPPPSFPTFQICFIDIILSARSPAFNQHLVDQLAAEIEKKWKLLMSVVCDKKLDHLMSYKSIRDILFDLHVFAKFLGFIEFLPYRSPSRFPSTQSTKSSLRRNANLHCDVVNMLEDAEQNGCLLLAVTFIVHYISQIDVITLHTPAGRNAVNKLFAVYCLSASWESTLATTALVFCLGWLFEACIDIQGMFYAAGKTTATSRDKVMDDRFMMTTDDLVTICPFIDELHVLLLQSAAGVGTRSSSLRKITPIQHDQLSSGQRLTCSKIQRDLRDNFFRNQPKYLKDLVTMCTQIMTATVPRDVWETVEEHVTSLVTASIERRKDRNGVRGAASLLPFVMEDVVVECHIKMDETLEKICKERACQALSALMAASTPKQVVRVAAHIIYEEAKLSCTKSLHSRFSSAVETFVFHLMRQQVANEKQHDGAS